MAAPIPRLAPVTSATRPSAVQNPVALEDAPARALGRPVPDVSHESAGIIAQSGVATKTRHVARKCGRNCARAVGNRRADYTQLG